MSESDCVIWPGAKTRGYGVFRHKGRNYYVHRVIYEAANGVSSEGIVVRHTCDTPACYNPLHLVGGTQGENMRDMVEKRRHYLHGTTECSNGHPWSSENTRIDKTGARRCRVCAKDRVERWRSKNSGAFSLYHKRDKTSSHSG